MRPLLIIFLTIAQAEAGVGHVEPLKVVLEEIGFGLAAALFCLPEFPDASVDLVGARPGNPLPPMVTGASLWCRAVSGEGGGMVSIDLLGIYLNEHLGGSIAGVEVAEKLRSKNEGTPFGTALAGLVLEVKEDRATLENLMDRLGIERNPAKQAAGRGLEKLGRLRTSKQLTGSAEVSRLMDIETLSRGIEGKSAMWRALKEVGDLETQLATTDFDGLAERARRQRETLEPYQLQAAALAFSSES